MSKYTLTFGLLTLLLNPLLAITSDWTGSTNSNWNVSTNWSNGIPGTASPDAANFLATAPGTISLDSPIISPGLNSLTFGTSSFTITSATQKIQFNLNGSIAPTIILNNASAQTIDAAISINGTTGTVLTISAVSGATLNLKKNISDISATTSNVTFTGPGQLNYAPSAAGASFNLKGTFTQSSGTVKNVNNNSVSTPNQTGSNFSTTLGFTLNGGTFANSNTAAVTAVGGGSVGANFFSGTSIQVNTAGVNFNVTNTASVSNSNPGMPPVSNIGSSASTSNNFALSDGNVLVDNAGAISQAGIGAQISANNSFLLSNTGTLTVNNSGNVTGGLVQIGAGSIVTGKNNITISGGSVNSTNSGQINAGDGTNISSNGVFTITGGSVTNTNNAVNIGSTGKGCVLQGQSDLTISGGTVNAKNSANLASQNGVGSFIASATGNLVIAGGTLNQSNTGSIVGQGCVAQAKNDLIVSSGTLTGSNSGIVASGGVGTWGNTLNDLVISGGTVSTTNSAANSGVGNLLSAANLFSVTSGALTLGNTGTLNGGVGSSITSLNTNISGGSVTLSNNGSFSSGIGSSLASASGNFLMTGGSLNCTNDVGGTLSGNADGNRVLFNSGSFTLSGGTFTQTNKGVISSTSTSGCVTNALNFVFSGGTFNAVNSAANSAGNGITTNTNGSTSNIDITGTTLNLANTGNLVNSGTGVALYAAGNLNFSNGTVTASNSGSLHNLANGCFIGAVNFNLSSTALLNLTNTGTLADNSLGNRLDINNTFTITGGTANISNAGVVASTSSTSYGAFFIPRINAILSGGAINFANTGAIGSNGIGVSFNPATLNISAGTYNFSNSGTLTGTGIGAQLISRSGAFLMSGGSLNFENKGPTHGSSFGCYMETDVSTTISGGNLRFINSGNSPDAGEGVFMQNQSFAMSGGSVLFENKGQVGALIGPNNGPNGTLFVSNTNTTIDNGLFSMSNSGTVTQNAANLAIITGDLILNNGTIIADNSGAIAATTGQSATGTAFASQHFVINNGIFSISNSGPISSSGCVGSSFNLPSSIQVNGGQIHLSNSGAVTGDNSFGSNSTVQLLTIKGGSVFIAKNTGTAIGTNTFGSRIRASTRIDLSGGILNNNDSVQSRLINVTNNGLLTGSGQYTGLRTTPNIVVTNSGTVLPGNLTSSHDGTLSIAGGYKQTAAGTLQIDILNASTYSQLHILGTTPGTADLAGNLRISVLPGATVSASDAYTIVLTDNPIGVIGSHFTVIDPPNFRSTVQYLPNSVLLQFRPTNAFFVGNYAQPLINSINETNVRLGRQIMNLHGRMSKQTAPIQTASLLKTAESELLASAELMLDLQDVDTRKNVGHKQMQRPWEIYCGPTGNFGQVSASANQTAFDYWSAGAILGADYAFTNAGIGFMLDYDYIDGHRDNVGKFLINEAHGSLYGTISPTKLPELAFNAIVGGSYEWYDMYRTVATAQSQPKGKTEGGEFDALLGVEYAFQLPKNFKLVPLANAQYVYIHVNDYNEKNGDTYNLHIDSQTVQSLRSTLGSRLQYTWNQSARFKLTSELDFAWQREFMNKDLPIAYSPIAFIQPTTTLIIPGSGRNVILAGIDFRALWNEKYGCDVSYDFEWNESFLDHSFYVGFKANF